VVIDNPPAVAAPIGAYSHVATVPPGTQMLFLAGQIGIKKDGSITEGVDAQYEQALRNIAAILESHGASPRNLVKITIFLVEPLDPNRAAARRRAVFGDALPPATLVYVSRLARSDLLVEIEAIAALSRAT
jgi:enamine deaminase RidA (YjgF/YER057c/UK114 family)